MPHFADRTRRDLLTAVAGASLGSAMPAAALSQGFAQPEKPILVAYFSRSGNTRVVAGLVQRAFNADVFEILPAVAYPDEYLATVEQVRQEHDQKIEPVIKAEVPDIVRYARWGPYIQKYATSVSLSPNRSSSPTSLVCSSLKR